MQYIISKQHVYNIIQPNRNQAVFFIDTKSKPKKNAMVGVTLYLN